MSNSVEKKIICTACPRGCEITIKDKNGELEISGFSCKKGEEYAREEYISPKRILTTTAMIKNGELPLCPVRTEQGIPKGMIFQAMKIISNIIMEAPIEMGDIIIENILNTGINLVSSRNVKMIT